MQYMLLCLIVKDEPSLYLREWVDFHLLAGAERIVVYDHGSGQPVSEVLGGHVSAGLVDVLPVTGTFPQLSAYAHCLEQYGPKFRWIGFLDADEFLIPKAESDFRLILERFEKYAGFAVNWTMFGSSGHTTRPDGLLVENYLQALPENEPVNHHVKTFLDPSRTVRPLSPHHFSYTGNEYCVNERRLPVHGPRCPRSVELAQVNHYYYRSRQDFAEKMQRGFAQDVPGRNGYAMEEFERQRSMETHEDHSALGNLSRLRAMVRSEDAALTAGFVRDRDLPPDRAVHTGLALAGRGRIDDAVHLLRIACVRFPDPAFIRSALAGVLRNTGRTGEATGHARRALVLDASPEGWLEYGLCLKASGDRAGAASVGRWIKNELVRTGEWDSEWDIRLSGLFGA